jgi:CubicO group peptidase (beta-lactamase class C family)
MKKLLVAILLLNASFALAQAQSQVSDQAFETKLGKIHEHIEDGIKSGKIPGAVVIISRDGKVVYHEDTGYANIDEHIPLTDNTIFRWASMSKVPTAAGILVLVDRGIIKLSDPLSKYIPEFKHMLVAVQNNKDYKPDPNAPLGDTIPGMKNYHTVPANREMTIKDMLTHSCGVTQGGVGMTVAGRIKHMPGETIGEYLPKMAAVPLDFQPGTRTGYTFLIGFDLLGRVIEVASGEPLDKFLEENVFKPCDMKHAGFAVKGTDWSKIPLLYNETPGGLAKPTDTQWFVDSVYFSGAGGMIGTVTDYYHFAQMLANDGVYKGKRVLSSKIIHEMETPELPDTIKGFGPGQIWGLGVRVITSNASGPLPVGTFGWSGAFGTHFWIDPTNKIIAVYMINVENMGGAGAYTARQLESDVMDAVKQ